jgi:hypothetical protein
VIADRAEDVPPGPAGCYTLRVAGDTVGGEGAGDVPPGLLPRILVLDTARLPHPAVVDGEERSAYAAHAFVGSRRQDHPFNRWVEPPGDSVRVDHTGAMAGVILRLAVTEEGLSGGARTFGDVMDGPEAEAGDGTFGVRGVRTSCPGGGG